MKVLYVEDHPEQAERTRRALQGGALPFDLTLENSLLAALDRLDREAGQFDVALIGPRLAQGDGLRALARLREGSQPMAVVQIVEPGDQHAEETARQAGVDETLALDEDYAQRLPVVLQQALDRLHNAPAAGIDYRSLVENAADLVYRYRLDPAPGFEYVSPAAALLTGHPPEAFYADPELGRPLVQPQSEPDSEPGPRAVRWTRPDGKVVWIETHNAVLRDAEGKPAAIEGIAHDVTARRQVEEKLRHQVRRLLGTRRLDPPMTAGFDMSATLELILTQVVEQFQVDAAVFLLLSRSRHVLEVIARRGFHTDALRYTHLSLGEGHAGKAALERRPVFIPDLPAQLGELHRAPLLEQEGFQAYLALPLIAGEDVKGVLEIFQRGPLAPAGDWLESLQDLGRRAATAVENARMVEDLQRSHKEVSLAFDAALESWAQALELRDQEARGHSRRITEMTLELARRIGIPEPERVHIRRGALLHDIGKMVVPDELLRKPGPLDEDEWEIVRRHPALAYEMLQPIEFLRPALAIPYGHHERWDGSGYPQGLAGESIPLPARIFAVVDVWDALLSNRPYRPAWPREWAVAYLKEQAGKAFDPQVVAAFLEMIA